MRKGVAGAGGLVPPGTGAIGGGKAALLGGLAGLPETTSKPAFKRSNSNINVSKLIGALVPDQPTPKMFPSLKEKRNKKK